ncbi:MAG: hypothetical protein LBN43_05835, partial [Oscillospiraceae bacterium]|nr:hypothetical protein [Oscillospiraceae bacterium]
MAIPSNPVVGTKYKFGTFYMNNTKQIRPTKPYQPDSAATGAPSAGDTPKWSSGNIEFRDTDASDAYQAEWVYVGNGKYILSYNAAVSMSWNTLDTQGYVAGQSMTIDGVLCQVGLMSGGTASGDNGGTPANDWDNYIGNVLALGGLPTPTATDLDNSLVAADYTSTHGAFWHWASIYSWMKDTYQANQAYRVIRGYTGARYFSGNNPANAGVNYGFRPALLILNSAPLISEPAADGSLGNKSASFTQQYTVSEADGEIFSILAKVDTTTVLSLSNQSAGTFPVDLSEIWGDLSLGTHTLT